MIAQLVGGENVFIGIYGSLVHLYDEEGIAGWFRWAPHPDPIPAPPPSFLAPWSHGYVSMGALLKHAVVVTLLLA